VHYAKIDSVEVTEEQVESEIDARMNQIPLMMNTSKNVQEVYGQTVKEMLSEQVKDDMQTLNYLLNKMRS
jgi:hypothetical protein